MEPEEPDYEFWVINIILLVTIVWILMQRIMM